MLFSLKERQNISFNEERVTANLRVVGCSSNLECYFRATGLCSHTILLLSFFRIAQMF